ncbi:MAG: P-type ATPase, partial [Intrasporangium sp.]|uniref:P-type ATPase n=1 Tax=Intrasporangium sp. TaxID=1925024 RepID=UPI003F7F32F0
MTQSSTPRPSTPVSSTSTRTSGARTGTGLIRLANRINPRYRDRRADQLIRPGRSATSLSQLSRQLLTTFPQAVAKLDPRHVWRSPVMFVVWVGSVITTASAIVSPSWFSWAVTVWLWATVLFANMAEAVAEGRGKAQAASLRASRRTTTARRRRADGFFETVAASELAIGDIVTVRPNEVIPGDGDVIEGMATVDESAITGESAPVIRESGGDRSAVTGGTTVLSDGIAVRITTRPGETFIDRMIALVEGAARQKTPNELALTILLVILTVIFV